MAGDWIKMRVDLANDPAVVGIATLIGLDEDAVVGKLHRLWSWADAHTVDGYAPNITERWVDKYVGHSGFADAAVSNGWLEFDDSGIIFPNFDRHNGKGAKRRAEDAIRKRLSRSDRDNGRTGCGRQSVPRPIARAVLERDNYQCVYCGEISSKEREDSRKSILSIDHIIPTSRGGKSSFEELATCCKKCNNEKNDRTPEEWGVTPDYLQDGAVYKDGMIVVRKMSAKTADNIVTREEKRRDKEDVTNVTSKKNAKPRFKPPTVADVSAYCTERNNTVDPQAFCDYYASVNWHVGKKRMSDWRAAVRTWEKRNAANQRSNGKDHRTRTEKFFDACREYANSDADDMDREPVRKTAGEVRTQVVEFIPRRDGESGDG